MQTVNGICPRFADSFADLHSRRMTAKPRKAKGKKAPRVSPELRRWRNEVLRRERKAQKDMLTEMTRVTDLDLTNLAKSIGDVPSTLTRFNNSRKATHLLSSTTVALLRAFAPIPSKKDF